MIVVSFNYGEMEAASRTGAEPNDTLPALRSEKYALVFSRANDRLPPTPTTYPHGP